MIYACVSVVCTAIWSTRYTKADQIRISNDIYVTTTIRELVLYCVYLIIITISALLTHLSTCNYYLNCLFTTNSSLVLSFRVRN